MNTAGCRIFSRHDLSQGVSFRWWRPIVSLCGCQEVWHWAALPSCPVWTPATAWGVIDTEPFWAVLRPAAGCLQDHFWSKSWLLGHHVTQQQRNGFFPLYSVISYMLWIELFMCYCKYFLLLLLSVQAKDIFRHTLNVWECLSHSGRMFLCEPCSQQINRKANTSSCCSGIKHYIH